MRKSPQASPLRDLYTPFEGDLQGCEVPFADYPRPQFRRDSYLCLNGWWDFSVGEEDWGKILVPFVPESRISGIGRPIPPHKTMHYRRVFTLPEGFCRGRVLLHLGPVDQEFEVFVNDVLVGEAKNGTLPFTFDVTDALIGGENALRVDARDPMDTDLPYGKQSARRGGIWYTPFSGIWQTVWLESVPETYMRGIKMTPTLDSVIIEVDGGAEEKILRLKNGDDLEEFTFSGEKFTLPVKNPRLWTPETPHLYSFTLRAGEDEAESYFALRTVSIEKINDRAQICLNGVPYFFHGLLDQGYYSDGICLPATAEGFRGDILHMKACGFNMLRKHIKLEPEVFYYECDRLGMVVFQDMVNSGKYNFLIDTALPTVFLKKGNLNRSTPRSRAEFLHTAKKMQALLHNHPSVCYYTIFNEGWGQFDAPGCYEIFKNTDPTRVYDTTSGWFKVPQSDVESDHVYFKPVKLRAVPGKPMVLSEFGGYSCRVAGHYANLKKNYGCRVITTDPKIFEEALVKLYENEVLPAIRKGLSAAVLTQVSDVEDETNGLLTYDRQVLKVQPEVLANLAQKLQAAYRETNGKV